MKIKNVFVNNFKSLVDFEITDFSDITVFFGENNAGKSNLLEILSIVFKRKKQLSQEELTESPVVFYTGVLEEFSHSFHLNDFSKTIEIRVTLSTCLSELKLASANFSLITGINIENDTDNFDVLITATITSYRYNKRLAYFDVSKIQMKDIDIYNNIDGVLHYLPTMDPNKEDQGFAQYLFSLATNELNDCVLSVSNNRIMLPTVFDTKLTTRITATDFKRFLYSIYLDESSFVKFEEINRILSDAPFDFGTISFSKIGDELEVMIMKNHMRLPLKSLGSGVLQILYIVSCIVYAGKRIVCLEEPEQNLSPTNQNALLSKCSTMISSSGPNQFIISSHSPFYYQKSGLNKTYLLANEFDKTLVKARNGDFEVSSIEYFSQHFPGLEDFY